MVKSVEDQIKELKQYVKEHKDEKACLTCKYFALFEGVCCNGESPYRADFTGMHGFCEHWQGK